MKETLLIIPGAQELIDFYGYWPSFHDAEVLGLALNRSSPSVVHVHCFTTTKQISKTGHYICEKHAIVSLTLEEVGHCELSGFNNQNVLSGLVITPLGDGYEVELGGCYGLAGTVKAAKLAITIEPGLPPGSIYAGTTERNI